VASLRAPLFAVRVTRAHAALRGRSAADQTDASIAARLVLAPRATVAPQLALADEERRDPDDAEETSSRSEGGQEALSGNGSLAETLIDSARSSLPPDLLSDVYAGSMQRRRNSPGRAGALQRTGTTGRPIGSRRGNPREGTRLDVVETLKAAAPWQRIRGTGGAFQSATPLIQVRRDDFRVFRLKQRSETATIFVVDTSGSTAAQRLGEAKGAVELLLAECYVRRDQVALLTFGGRGAEIILPPTRSLSRTKRCLASIPGGGRTPLAAAITAAANLAHAVRRKGRTPLIVLLTDGSANTTRDGNGDRALAQAEALEAARALHVARLAAILIDTSRNPRPIARQLAEAMAAKYISLPKANAAALAEAVQAAKP
jgi:magnesium chelatase subunit D